MTGSERDRGEFLNVRICTQRCAVHAACALFALHSIDFWGTVIQLQLKTNSRVVAPSDAGNALHLGQRAKPLC